MIKEILSSQNPNFKRWKQLLESRGSKKQGQMLVSGQKIVPEVLKITDQLLEVIIESEDQVEGLNIPRNVDTYKVPSRHFKELDIFGTNGPLVVLKTKDLPSWNSDEPPKGLELLCGLGDPTNLGAFLRSAEAFGASKVILLKESVYPFHPKVIKTSSGSCLRLRLEQGPSIHALPDDIYVLDKRGHSLNDFSWPKDLRLLIGEEGRGIPEGIAKDHWLAIPIANSVESLNAVAATAVALYAYRIQHLLQDGYSCK